MLCLDNDEAGHFACQQIREKYRDRYKIVRYLSQGKDFNDQLLNIKNSFNQHESYVNNIVAEDEESFSK